MGMLWWILPALAAVVGLMLSFAGVGRLMKLNILAGGLRFLFGIGFMGLAGIATFAGLNLQTYKALTKERMVAEITFDKDNTADDTYTMTLTLPEGEVIRQEGFVGDEFQVSAQVIRFSPMRQMLGYDSLYRLEYVESRYARRYNSTELSTATSYGRRVSEDPKVNILDQEIGLDVYGALVKYSGEEKLDKVLNPDTADAEKMVSAGPLASKDKGSSAPFGSAVYFPMDDKLKYTVSITQSALVVEPNDAATRRRMLSGN